MKSLFSIINHFLPILCGVGGLCGGVVLLLGELTEFVAVKILGLFGSNVTRDILVAVFFLAWEENLNDVSEGIREIKLGSLKTKKWWVKNVKETSRWWVVSFLGTFKFLTIFYSVVESMFSKCWESWDVETTCWVARNFEKKYYFLLEFSFLTFLGFSNFSEIVTVWLDSNIAQRF